MGTVFISCSHKDGKWKNRLVSHLNALVKADLIEVWEDRQIQGGDNWKAEIEKAIGTADVALLMISANFLSSDFIRKEEVPPLLMRREKEGTRIIPLIVNFYKMKTDFFWDRFSFPLPFPQNHVKNSSQTTAPFC